MSNPQAEQKKPRRSFLSKIFRTSKKPNKSGDETFNRNDSLYHSFHCSSIKSDDSANFTTLEDSAFLQMHKDAGIIFLNQNSNKEEDSRHVQFVPTPMNKYYRVDCKKAPAKRLDDNKENVDQVKPSRSILRLSKSRDSLSHSSDVSKVKVNASYVDGLRDSYSSDIGKVKVNTSCVDGPQLKNASLIPRSSTKVGLLDRTNGSLPQLNVSSITKYGSLPRNAQIYTGDVLNSTMLNQNGSSINNQSTSMGARTNLQRRFEPKLDKYECRSIPNIPKLIEHKKIQQQSNRSSHRLSLGDNFVRPAPVNDRSSFYHAMQQNVQTATNLRSVIKGGNSSSIEVSRANAMPTFEYKYQGNVENRLPNHAINEIGLPIVMRKPKDASDKHRSRSESPHHYIPLSEAYSSRHPVNEFPKNKTRFGNNFMSAEQYRSSDQHIFPTQTRAINNQLRAPHASRKLMTKERMYNHKRQFLNKICKYRSKECEDGFSSMADDECSFNCSCSSCMSRAEKGNNTARQILPENDDDKFFFILTESGETNGKQEPVKNPEMRQGGIKPMPLDKIEEIPEIEKKGTWYDCDDSLCKTPVVEQNDKATTEEENITDNVYENVIVKSEDTKKIIEPQDVERMFSTPIMKSKFKEILTESAKKLNPKSLFGGSDSQVLSPARSPIVFSDSIILLQEIFQKLSRECRDLLRPEVSRKSPASGLGDKYVNDLVKNLKTTDISEGDFANIIGGIAQNIFMEAKSKRQMKKLTHSASLPDLSSKENMPSMSSASSLQVINPSSSVSEDTDSGFKTSFKTPSKSIVLSHLDNTASSLQVINPSTSAPEDTIGDSGFKTGLETPPESIVIPHLDNTYAFGEDCLPEGWNQTPTTENASTITEYSKTDTSTTSESDLQLLENVIRLGMGLSPVRPESKAPLYSETPTKSKYRSKEVLSGKGKLKLKVYNNCGLVTIHIIKGSKLRKFNIRDLNTYVKVSMVPDNSKRVHWRTTVQKGQKNPVFDQKFSFEVLAEDSKKRLVFSVWHRDLAKGRSELVGCMSFSVKHILDPSHKINGWYRLLREGFGTQKHFAAHTKKHYFKKYL